MPKHVIGLVGPIASGTSTCKDILKARGFCGQSYGTEVAEYIVANRERGEINRSNLQYWGQKALEEEHDLNFWDRRIFEKITRSGALTGTSTGVVLDSLKYHFQISFWKSYSETSKHKFHLIRIDAPEQVRCARLIARANKKLRTGEPKNPEEFELVNARDLEGFHTPEYGQDTASCLARTDFDLKIHNNKSLEELQKQLIGYVSFLRTW